MSDQIILTLTASLFTLLGVIYTLRKTQETHEKNLQHERQKARDEREYTARQTVFADMVSSVTRVISQFTALPDTEMAQWSANSDTENLAIAVNRLQFYATIETIEKATELDHVLTGAVARLMATKLPWIFLGEDIRSCDTEIAKLEQWQLAIQQEITALLNSTPSSPEVFARRKIQENYMDLIIKSKVRKADLSKKRWSAAQDGRRVVQEELSIIYTTFRDFLIVVRRDLKFDIDEQRYEKLITTRVNQALKLLESTLSGIEAQVDNKLKEIDES